MAELKLCKSDERFRRVMESELLGIVLWDENGVVHEANVQALRLLQRAPEQLASGQIRLDDFTTKPSGHGTGLGLATALAFAQRAGGGMRCASILGEGSVFTLLLPCVTRPIAESATAPSAMR